MTYFQFMIILIINVILVPNITHEILATKIVELILRLKLFLLILLLLHISIMYVFSLTPKVVAFNKQMPKTCPSLLRNNPRTTHRSLWFSKSAYCL